MSANASFIVLFEFSSLIGPVMAGFFLDKSIKFGLSLFLIIIGVMYILIAKIRDFQRAKNQANMRV